MTLYYSEPGIKIFLGNCLDMTEWLQGDVLVTDPPYGVDFAPRTCGAFSHERIIGDKDPTARDLALQMWGDKPALVFGQWTVPMPPGVRMVLIWDKGDHVGMGDLNLPWKPNHEQIYVLGKGFSGHRGSGVLHHLAIAGTVGRADMGTRFHPVEKPVGLMRDLIRKCPPGVIVDPFMGSGTTLRAAKDLGREAIGVEVREDYAEIAVRKLSQGVLFGAEVA